MSGDVTASWTDDVWSARSLTNFVGRAVESDRLAKLLDAHRLVTVTGAGGVGKTRLAAEVTKSRIASGALWGAWPVELATVEEPADVAVAVADSLGCRHRSGASILASIAALLASEPACLVLDNCEHVIGAVAQLCAGLLSENDEVRILATSREPIGIPGEARMRLGSLTTRPNEKAADSDAVRLFVDRAKLADPDFRLTNDTRPQVEELVSRLDGLPLAIELAAARCEALGLTELTRRLDDPLSVLTTASVSTAKRHRSLRATVEWSYRLLTPDQQRVLCRLAIIPGSFTLSAAEAVVGESGVLEVPRLVDWSLLAPSSTFPDGRLRYVMPDTVRAFAREFSPGQGAETESMEAISLFAVRLAERAALEIRTPGREATAAAGLDAEEALMRHALAWCEMHDQDAARRLAVALAGWWQLRGRAPSGYASLHKLLSGTDRGELWLAGQIWLGRLAHSIGDWPTALQHFATAYDSADGGQSSQRVDALTGRAGTHRNLFQVPEANADAFAALELSEKLQYVEGQVQALIQLSLTANYINDQDAALNWAARAARLGAAEIPDRVKRRVAIALATVQADAGLSKPAQEACAEGLELARRAGDLDLQADFLYFAARIALRERRPERAREALADSLRLAIRSGDRLRVAGCIDECASLCAMTGRRAEAVTLWTVHSLASGIPGLPHEQHRRADEFKSATKQLGPAATSDAERRGAQLSIAAATELAMLTLDSPNGGAEIANEIPSFPLTRRESQLLVLVAEGSTDAQIADRLFISIRTVHSHLDRIREKTGSRRRADLTRLAIAAGLI